MKDFVTKRLDKLYATPSMFARRREAFVAQVVTLIDSLGEIEGFRAVDWYKKASGNQGPSTEGLDTFVEDEWARAFIDEIRAFVADRYTLPHEAPCWLVWERAQDGGRPHLRAIDTSEQFANRHVAYLKENAKYYDPPRPPPDLVIEDSRINHLYAANIIAALQKRGKRY